MGSEARHLRVVRRADELPGRGRLRIHRRRRRGLHRLVAGNPPDRQGHRPPALRVLAGDADVGRCRAAEALGDRRLAARRRREDVEDLRQRGQPARPDRRHRPRRLPLLRARRDPLRQRRRLHLRGPRRPVQLRPGQQPRQPRGARGDGGRQEVRRRRHRAQTPTARSPLPPPPRSPSPPRTGPTSSRAALSTPPGA